MVDDLDTNEAAMPRGPRIEGGYDAVVVGGAVDGMVAAAYLTKAGLKTVLLEAGVTPPQRREFAPGFFADDGDLLVRHLDPDVVNTLDLYRHGLCFVQRRLDTTYYFADRSALLVSGDLFCAYESVSEMDDEAADAFQRFVEQALESARELRPFFNGEPAQKFSKRTQGLLERYGAASLDEILDRYFTNPYLKDILRAEASMHSGVRPSDPHSFLSLLRRWSGEAAGLQGGAAFASGGYSGVYAAMRRALQAQGVEVRSGANVERVLVEFDEVAGVELSSGGQIRAPIVVNALSSQTVFLDHLGPGLIDLEFQRVIAASKPLFASAKVHFALSGAAKDETTRKNLSRRLVYAPDQMQQRRALRLAREGRVASSLAMELIFPSVFEPDWAPEGGNVAAAFVHPLPYRDKTDEELTKEVREAALSTLDNIAPGAAARLEGLDVQLCADRAAHLGLPPVACAGVGPVLADLQRARLARTAANIRGLFFCGPDAQVGTAVSGAAGRAVVKDAISFSRTKSRAA